MPEILIARDVFKGFLCSKRSLANFLTGSLYFVNNVLTVLVEMGSTIACNAVRPNVNDSLNSYLVCNDYVYINMLCRFQWLLFCGLCGFAFVVCVSFVDKMGVVYGATLQQLVVSIGKRRQGCNIWKF